MPLVQLGVEQTLSWSEGPRRRPALDCLSAKFEEPDVDVKVLIDTQAKSWRRAHFVSHTHSAAQSTVTDFYSDPSLFRRTCPFHGVRSAEGSPAASLPTSGLTELLQRCQTRRTPQGYLNSALYSPSTRWQTVDSLYLRWIRKAWTGTDGRKWNEERQDGENEKMRQKGKDGEQIDAFTSWLVLLKSSG